MERTLVVLKPDAVRRGIIGEIISRFERVGLKLVGMKMIWPDRRHFDKHYEEIGKLATRKGQAALDVTLEYVAQSPVVAMVMEGVEAVELVRKMVGGTEPKQASPGTIRGDYAHLSYAHADKHKVGVANIVHASGDSTEAEAEIDHWFDQNELFDYRALHEPYTQPRQE